MRYKFAAFFFILINLAGYCQVTPNRSLILTSKGEALIKQHLGEVPLFDGSLENIKTDLDKILKEKIEVPVPRDLAGGYTHEKHKSNFFQAQQAGLLYQITGSEKYADFVKQMLIQYAELYPTLPLHPEERSYARGKIFWQALNDANWLVYMSQAYGSIYNYLSAKEKNKLEQNLFRPFADFLSKENPQFFNRIHNHSTWGNAAVGMIALVMQDDELLERALYGLDTTEDTDFSVKDNDGGYILQPGQDAGFLANINQAFSPSGYYTEGPYYQRYAMYPFLIFAVSIENLKPELDIFQFKDGVLLKAVSTLINLTDNKGEFFALNDAQKGMSLESRELVSAVGIAYYFGDRDPALLSVIKEQGRVNPDEAGFAAALAIKEDKAAGFPRITRHYTDGPLGNSGGLSVLRYTGKKDTIALLYKYTSHGDSHGHFDKLSYSLHNNRAEVLQDYGLVRFVNIDAKNGGGYLKENTTWAKQSIAHNTIVQNEVSHFKGDYETGSKYHSELFFQDTYKDSLQIISAKDHHAYEDTELHRTLVLLGSTNKNPVLIDVFRIKNSGKHQYDLPFHYFGQLIQTTFEIEIPSVLQKLGEESGYQHLYKEGASKGANDFSQFTWLDKTNKFYTLNTRTSEPHKVILARLGANDPDFNLRRDPSLLYRVKDTRDPLWVTVLESHGTYDPVTEKAVGANTSIDAIKILENDDRYTAVELQYKNGDHKILIIVNSNIEKKQHRLRIGKTTYEWEGPYYIN